MMPTVQFDPATLALWTTTGALPEDAAQLAASAMKAAARGENPQGVVAGTAETDPNRRLALWLASCVWHEKRHFFDVCLTNYGARRFRDLFRLAVNVWPLVAEMSKRGEPVCFPVEIYDCEANRYILGISQPSPNIAEVARGARAMKELAGEMEAPWEFAGKAIHLGGQAQLEGLAQVSQTHAIEHRFGPSEAIAVTSERVHRQPHEGAYRAIETVAGVLGCAKEDQSGVLLLNAGLASALFVTALSGRYFGVGREAPADFVKPSLRLARLLEELGPSAGSFSMTDEAAWELVDEAARRLWGRTAIEEIEADIEAMDAATASMKQPWLDEERLPEAWADFVSLRRRLIEAVRTCGPADLSPRAFPIRWVDRLLPWHIVATPGGDVAPSGAPMVLGRELNPPAGWEAVVPRLVVWARLQEASPDATSAGFAPRNRAAWLQMVERHAPRARLMLNGRRHRLMVPQEIERAIEEFKKMGVSVRFIPEFEWPETRDRDTCVAEALELSEWTGRKTFCCDLTGTEILAAHAAVVTPWEFRRSPLLQRFYERFEPNEKIFAEVKLITDWSDWIVRSDLLPN